VCSSRLSTSAVVPPERSGGATAPVAHLSERPAAVSLGEWRGAGEDQRCVFVARRDALEQVLGVLLEGKVADLVDDDQPVAAQPRGLLREHAFPAGIGDA